LNSCVSNLVYEQSKIFESKKKARAKKTGKDDEDVSTLNLCMQGQQIIASCQELSDFVNFTAMKQHLLMKLTGTS
jgi:hypothetical protein